MRTRVAVFWLLALLIGVAVVSSDRPAKALVAWTWTGNGTTNNWSDAANWDAGVPPPGSSLIFPVNANRKQNVNDLAPNTALLSIDFAGSGYDISGNAIALTGLLSNHSGSGSNRVSLALAGAGGVQQTSGRLILSGANAFAGAVVVDGGFLQVANNQALGDATGETTVNAPGTLEIAGSVSLGLEVIHAGGVGDGDGAVQSLVGQSTIAKLRLMGDTTVGVARNSVLVVDTLYQDASGGFELVGSGKLQINTSFFAGDAAVNGGNLTWNASSQAFVGVAPSGMLRGTGMVSQVTVGGGVVRPGSGGAHGILSVFTNTTFNAGYFWVAVGGPGAGVGYSQLATNGLALNPLATLLDLDIDGPVSPGEVYRIIDNTGGLPVSGTFMDLPEGAVFVEQGFAWKISYKGGTGNDVTLTVLRVASADLVLQMTAAPDPANSGGALAYTIVVTNNGPDAAASPTVSMGTPVGTSYVSASKPANWTCAKPSPGPSVSCSGPTMDPGEAVSITLTFNVDTSTGPISGTAGVSSPTNDPNSANNAVTLSTPVGPVDPYPFKRFLSGLARD